MPNPFNTASKNLRASSRGSKAATPQQVLPAFKSGQPEDREWDDENAIKDGFKSSTWVYAAIRRIMDAVSSVPWTVGIEEDRGQVEPIPGHPLALLLNDPNPFMTKSMLIGRMVAHLYLSGNGLLTKVTTSNRSGEDILVELWPLSPVGLKPVPTKTQFISHYELQVDGEVKEIPAEDVVHMMFIDPETPYWGMSPLQAAARTVDTDVEAVKWNRVALQNRAITDGVFTFDHPLTREQWEEARDRVRQLHQGPENARAPWVLGSGARWNAMSLSPAEMDFINSRAFTRQEILAAFGVPPPLVGIFEDATLANVQESRRIFWLDTVIPLLDDIQEVFQLNVVPHFQDRTSGKLVVDYDLTNIDAVKENFSAKIDTATKMWEMGFPVDVIIQLLGIDIDEDMKWEGMEESFVPTNHAPFSMISGEADSRDGIL